MPVIFNLAYDSLSLKRIDANTSELVRKKAGKVVQTARRVISADRKAMTVTTTGIDDEGSHGQQRRCVRQIVGRRGRER